MSFRTPFNERRPTPGAAGQQSRALRFIRHHYAEHELIPSADEVAEALSTTANNASAVMRKLCGEGFLERISNGNYEPGEKLIASARKAAAMRAIEDRNMLKELELI